MIIPSELQTLLKAISQQNGRCILVGGCVRDFVMGLDAKDYDIEVYGISDIMMLRHILSDFGRVEDIGASFRVLQVKNGDIRYDFSLHVVIIK